jgi:hypothetical protein
MAQCVDSGVRLMGIRPSESIASLETSRLPTSSTGRGEGGGSYDKR